MAASRQPNVVPDDDGHMDHRVDEPAAALRPPLLAEPEDVLADKTGPVALRIDRGSNSLAVSRLERVTEVAKVVETLADLLGASFRPVSSEHLGDVLAEDDENPEEVVSDLTCPTLAEVADVGHDDHVPVVDGRLDASF